MSLKLNEIATISVGLLLNRKKASSKDKDKFNYKVISLKDFNDDAVYSHKFAENFIANEDLTQYLVQKGDILVRLREPNFAIYIDKDYPNLIYSSLVAKIRVKNFNPLFIAHYLNSSVVKRRLLKDISGTSIPTINIKNLENINIPKISLQKQEYLVKCLQEFRKNNQILKNLITQNKKVQKFIIENLEQGI